MSAPVSAALLLTNRIVDVGAAPLSASAFWSLHRQVPHLDSLAGRSADEVAALTGLSMDDARRVVALLGASTAFAFERERLSEEGVSLVSALDDAFPPRLAAVLGDACPAFLLVAGPAEFLCAPAVAVVGSRDASEAAFRVAGDVASAAAARGRAVVSGLAGVVDQAATSAAASVGAPVVGVPTEGVRVVARNVDVRRRVHAGELCLASPYGPDARFSVGAAAARNKIVHGLAEVTLVVCVDEGKGATWEGAIEAMRRGFGHVAVWRGEGEGPGNATLVGQGAHAVRHVDELFELALGMPAAVDPPTQGSLFG